MKVMQVNCTYREGSTGKIMYDIHTFLKECGHTSVVCYGRGSDTKDEDVFRVCSNIYAKTQNLRSRITGLMYGGCIYSTLKLLRVIKKEKPDIVHLHCINGYFVNIYKLVTWLKKQGIKTVLTLHAEFMYTANCGHAYECNGWINGCGKCPRRKEETLSWIFDRTADSWKKMYDSFCGFDENLVVVSVSPWLMERAKKAPILLNKNHMCVLNGVDTTVFCVSHISGANKKLNVKNEKSVLLVTAFFSVRPNHPKGGYYLIELAKRNPEVRFFVAGNHEECFDLPENVELLGNVQNQSELAALYESVDISIVLSKRETFSMPVAESLCCGTPVIGFCAGAPEQISIPDYSDFVSYGDIDSLEEIMKEYLSRSFNRNEISSKAKEIYSSITMAEEYMKIYRGLYHG